MRDVIEEAMSLLRNHASVADPVAEMERLQSECPPEERFMFAMIWEGLAAAMNSRPCPGGNDTLQIAWAVTTEIGFRDTIPTQVDC